jgi:hypothetical protein
MSTSCRLVAARRSPEAELPSTTLLEWSSSVAPAGGGIAYFDRPALIAAGHESPSTKGESATGGLSGMYGPYVPFVVEFRSARLDGRAPLADTTASRPSPS